MPKLLVSWAHRTSHCLYNAVQTTCIQEPLWSSLSHLSSLIFCPSQPGLWSDKLPRVLSTDICLYLLFDPSSFSLFNKLLVPDLGSYVFFRPLLNQQIGFQMSSGNIAWCPQIWVRHTCWGSDGTCDSSCCTELVTVCLPVWLTHNHMSCVSVPKTHSLAASSSINRGSWSEAHEIKSPHQTDREAFAMAQSSESCSRCLWDLSNRVSYARKS